MKKYMTPRTIALILLLKVFLVVAICSFIKEYDGEGKILSVVLNFITDVFCYLSLALLCLIDPIRSKTFLWIIIIPAVNEIGEWCFGIGWFNVLNGHRATLNYKTIDIAALFISMLIVYYFMPDRATKDTQ